MGLDLYQIFITHNRPWTVRELLCFSILLVIGLVISFYLLCHHKIVLSQALAGILLLIFLGIVFGSTVFTRTPNTYHDYQLELFWSWKAVFQGSREMLKENLLNMVLLLPAGLLLPIMLHKRLSWWIGLVTGILISAIIEICQLIFCRGLFEWDDMIHNGIGCMVGCVLCGVILKKVNCKTLIGK